MSWNYIWLSLFLSTLQCDTIKVHGTIQTDAGRQLIEMTHVIDNETVYFPGIFRHELVDMYDGPIDLGPGKDKGRYVSKYFKMAEHYGTHMDAPVHISSNPFSWTVDEIPIDRFFGEAVVIDITQRAAIDPDAKLLVDDIVRWEEDYGRIKDGSIVLMNSGWDKYWGNETAFAGNDREDETDLHFPGFSKEAAEWLYTHRMIYGVGVDTLSLDCGNTDYFYVHDIFLSNQIYGLENVKNIGLLPKAGAKLYVFPMHMKGGTGGQVRIIAEVDHEKNVTPVWSAANDFNLSLLCQLTSFITLMILYTAI